MPTTDRNFYLNLLHFAGAVVITCLMAMTITLLCILLTPHFPSFEVTSLTVSSMPINTTVHQKHTVTFNFQGLLENPNALLVVWYTKLHLLLRFNNSSLASLPLEPPPLPNKVQINIPFQAKFAVDTEKFPGGVLREMAAQRRAHGSVNFGITLRAWIKFKLGGVGFKPRFLSLECHPLQVAFSPEYNDKNETGILVGPSQCYAD